MEKTAAEKGNAGNTTLSLEQFDACTLHLAHAEALLDMAQDFYSSDQGPLISALTLTREQVLKARKVLTEAASHG